MCQTLEWTRGMAPSYIGHKLAISILFQNLFSEITYDAKKPSNLMQNLLYHEKEYMKKEDFNG